MNTAGKMRAGLAAGALITLLLLFCGMLLCSFARAADKYDFKLEEIRSGDKLDMASLTDGKALVFHMWSPECPHCQRHMPYVAGLYKKVDLEHVNFYTCSMADDKQEAVTYLDGKKLSFPVFYGPGGRMSETFTANGWPTTFVFSPGGKFVGWCDTQGPSYITEVLDLLDKALSQ